MKEGGLVFKLKKTTLKPEENQRILSKIRLFWTAVWLDVTLSGCFVFDCATFIVATRLKNVGYA
jgi:hypothetical protein